MKNTIEVILYILLGCVSVVHSETFPEHLSSFEEDTRISRDKVIVYNKPNPEAIRRLFQVPKKDRILVVLEPPSVQKSLHDPALYSFFGTVLSWKAGHTKFCYPVLNSMIEEVIPFEEKKLCCSISTNKCSRWKGELYSERRCAIDFFSQFPFDFDMFGFGWEKEGIATYRGSLPLDGKYDCMKLYRFSICYENVSDQPGYISEKIFDSFTVGCVPVYLGAPDVTDYIPPSCFIDKREFESYDALYSYLKKMSKEEYNHYLENIRNFLGSEAAMEFSRERFVEVLAKALLE